MARQTSEVHTISLPRVTSGTSLVLDNVSVGMRRVPALTSDGEHILIWHVRIYIRHG